MPTGIGSGIAGDVFQNLLGDGSGGGGGLVCPSRYSWQGDGVLIGDYGALNPAATNYVLGATSSSASIWYKPIDVTGAANLGAGLYATDASSLDFSSGTNIFTSPAGVLTASLGPMTFPAHPELITNGSFSNVPVGTELIANPTFSDAASITPWSITGAPNATKSWSARFMRIEYTVANAAALFQGSLGQTLNTMYSVKMRVRGVTAAGADQGSAFGKIGDFVALTSANIISNPTLTSEYQDYEFRVWSTGAVFRFYLASAAIGDVVDFDSISVKPLDMIITNGNFAVAGGWSNGTISGGQFTKTGPGLAYQTISVTEGKSYRAVVDVASLDGATQFWLKGTSSADLVVGENIIYIIAGSAADNYAAFNNGYSTLTGSEINSVSLEELGEDWIQIPSDPDSVSFGENGITIVQSSDGAIQNRVYQPNVTEAYKTYKVTYAIHSVSLTAGNSVKYNFGNGYIDLPEQGLGTHTFYYTRQPGNANWYFNLNCLTPSATDYVTISSTSVEEVLSENEWHHLALSIDRDSEWKWYVDGVLTNTMDNATDQAPANGLNTFGLTNVSTYTPGVVISSFYGNMTEPSLWNIPLSASEVKDIYDNMYGGQRCLGSLPFTSDLITNGNFTQIGPELITNGDFSATGVELADPLTSWTSYALGTSTVTYDGSIAELNIDALNSNVGIYQENIFSLGKSYKIVLSMKATASFDAEILEANNASLESNIGTASLTTSYQDFTYYFTATGTFDLFIHRLFSASGASQTISIQSVSVKELGEDWTDSGTPLKAATFDANGLTITSVNGNGNNNRVSQANVTEDAKSYKVTYTIHSATLTGANVFQYYNGSAYVTFSEQDAGTHTFYYTRQSTDDNWYFRIDTYDGSTTDYVTISSISVKEVGQNWTVINTDATHYVEFPGVGARYVADTMAPDLQLKQAGIITPGKAYTVTCNVAYASGSGDLKCNVGNAFSTPFTEGFNTETVTAGVGTDFLFLRDAANVDCVITNVTVTQVGGGNLERWWRMNGLEPLLVDLPNVAPPGVIDELYFQNSPLIQLDTP